MPLRQAEREIEMLTEGWPGEPEDFDLATFAARFRADRPELSAPALDRIGLLIQCELSRLDRYRARRQRIRATALRFRRFTPLAAAAVVAMAVGTWLHYRVTSPSSTGTPVQGVPVIHAQPAPSPDGASKPVVN